MDKCPFCGAGPLGADPEMPYFDCWMRKEGQERRTHKCLETEITELKAIVKEFSELPLPSIESFVVSEDLLRLYELILKSRAIMEET